MNYYENKTNNTRRHISLLELHTMIRETLHDTFPSTRWVRAEMSDVRVNRPSGHCYLEFIEKDEKTGQTVAKARGTIWARTFNILKPFFEKETKQAFSSGLKVLVNVSVDFHELYGYSLNVYDIDPSFTLGDLVRKRAEVLRRLQEEGIFNLNHALPFPLLPQRIALITSPSAAGYEDFIRQLTDNEYGYPFYIKLYPAVMQGEKTEESLIAALDRIFHRRHLFDVVVIIRGGGSTSELNSFDTYPLAAKCAKFPLPVITGIGHERDDTLVDMVAHTRMKTPTAVASFLIECMNREAVRIQKIEKTIYDEVTGCILREKTVLQSLTLKLPVTVAGQLERYRSRLQTLTANLAALPQLLRNRASKIDEQSARLHRATDALLLQRSVLLVEMPTRLQRASETIFLRRSALIIDMPARLHRAANVNILQSSALIAGLPLRLRRAFDTIYAERKQSIELNEQFIRMVSPEYILKRGYTLTYKNGRIVKIARDLTAGDEITVRFVDGEKKGVVI